jgi:hypothetical protein
MAAKILGRDIELMLTFVGMRTHSKTEFFKDVASVSQIYPDNIHSVADSLTQKRCFSLATELKHH